MSEILILGGRFCLLPKRYAADIRTMESDDARCVDCSWIVGGSMGAGRVLLRQPERGRRASKIHAIKTNNLAGADLGRCTPVNRPTGLKMYECLQARVHWVWGCFWWSFGCYIGHTGRFCRL